jgi:transposase InsO family protein
MKQRYPEASLGHLCADVDKSRQSYYERGWQSQSEDCRANEVVQLVHDERKQLPRLGTRKLYHLLRHEFEERALKVGRDKLFTILREKHLLLGKKRKYAKTTMSKHWMKKYPNLIKDLALERPEQVFVSDITYISTEAGFSYLSMVSDACSKKIMGYALSTHLGVEGCVTALQMALADRRTDKPLIHHSDRGFQYCSKDYVGILNDHHVQISMTTNGDPYENAIAERMNGILKEEFYCASTFADHRQAERHIAQSIKLYNTRRPHLSCHMLTPEMAHDEVSLRPKSWKTKKGLHVTAAAPLPLTQNL